MKDKHITVIARVKAKPGKEEDVLKELSSLIAPSRQDAGCLNYELHRSASDPASFMFHENWASRELLDRHLDKPDLQAALARLSAWVAEPPEISLWDKIG